MGKFDLTPLVVFAAVGFLAAVVGLLGLMGVGVYAALWLAGVPNPVGGAVAVLLFVCVVTIVGLVIGGRE